MLLSKLCSELSLLHLTQSAIFQMRIDLSRKLLATPLKRLQGMGKHRLLVILTEDVHTFTAAFEWVPLLFVNAVVTLACFAYLAWLSWSLLAILALFVGRVGGVSPGRTRAIEPSGTGAAAKGRALSALSQPDRRQQGTAAEQRPW
ncbi:hypothetical protein ACFQD2_07790 [Pseudomonas lini]